MEENFQTSPPQPTPVYLLVPPLHPPKVRPKYRLSLVLLIFTFLSTLLVGTELAIAYKANGPTEDLLHFYGYLAKNPEILILGLPFALTLLGILMAHEMGHYLACRYYGIHATLPYFIPFPNLIGTMGAFIRIKSHFPDRKALFDVGVAGPLAGFVLALPALVLTLPYSKLNPMLPGFTYFLFGESLTFKAVARVYGLHFPVGMDINYHPVAMAALVGLFATAINLLPVGQLDGGHIVYAIFGRRHRYISRGFAFGVIPILAFFWPWWALWAIIPLILGINHPSTLDDFASVDRPRKILAAVALGVFLLSFSLTPIRILP
jgi:membrane-associated protease RseP (regulator of RpoE activity)